MYQFTSHRERACIQVVSKKGCFTAHPKHNNNNSSSRSYVQGRSKDSPGLQGAVQREGGAVNKRSLRMRIKTTPIAVAAAVDQSGQTD